MTRLSTAGLTVWKPIVAFVHIPRTGGGSVTSAISRSIGRARSAGNVQISDEKSHKLLQRIAENPEKWSGRALADHVPYGLYARYLPADTQYVTFLRDPVERVLSHYFFHAHSGPEKLRTIWRRPELAGQEAPALGDDDDVSLEAGLARGITIYNNFQTRFIWGGESLDGELPPDAFEQAKANLERFTFVGVTERLDEAVILLGRMLGSAPEGYHLRHVRDRPQRDDVPESLIRLIEEHNALDIELYRVGRERFDAEAAEAGDVTADVEQLMQQRDEVSEEAEARRVERKAVGKARRRAAKAESGGRRRRGNAATPARSRGDLREELATLKRRMETIEAELEGTGTEESAANGASSPAAPGTKAARRGLPWRRERRGRGADAGAPADAEPAPAAQEPAGDGPVENQGAGRRNRGDGPRERKRPRQGEGERPKKTRQQARLDATSEAAGAAGDEAA